MFKNKKEIHFNFEDIKFKFKKDIDKIEEYLIFNNEFFTKKKAQLQSLKGKFFLIQVGH